MHLFKRLSLIVLLSLFCSVAYSGIDFDGADDLIDMGSDVFVFTLNITVTAWIKIDDNTVRNTIMSKWDITDDDRSWLFEVNSDGTLRAFVSTDGTFQAGNVVNGSTTLSEDTWYHVAFVHNTTDTDMLLYVNGALETGGNTSAPASRDVGGVARVMIGAEDRGAGTVNEFDGQITDVAFWTKALTVSELSIIAKSKIKGMPYQIQSAQLRGYYPLNEQPDGTSFDGDTAVDRSGNGNDGTGDNGANNTGLIAKAEEVLSYP